MRGPSPFDTDFAVLKRVPIRNRSLEFRAEFFNILNHPNFANPGNVIGTPGFGVITGSSASPRVIQFALKFQF